MLQSGFLKRTVPKVITRKKSGNHSLGLHCYLCDWLVKNGTALSTNHEQNHMTYDQPFPALFRGRTGYVWNCNWCNERLCFFLIGESYDITKRN